MPFYGQMGLGQSSDLSLFIRLHWLVSLKDAAMTVVLYLLIALTSRNLTWGRHLYKKRLLGLVLLGCLWAIGIEHYHVNVLHDWAYGANMPMIPGLGFGLWPILQMMVLPTTSILLSRRQLFI